MCPLRRSNIIQKYGEIVKEGLDTSSKIAARLLEFAGLTHESQTWRCIRCLRDWARIFIA
jgi:hypothetical protein